MDGKETDKECPKGLMSLALANNYLAVNLHRLLAEEKGNVFFSPFSISTAMAMLLCAAEGETESEMRAALGHDHAGIKKDEISCLFEQQMPLLLTETPNYTLSNANSMLSQKGFDVKEEYKQILAKSFKALLLEVDFLNENEKTVQEINNWVKEKTNDMIPELVQSLDPATVLVLLNAVYFKGTWSEKFEKEATYPQNFYNKGADENVKEIDMMHMKESFPFYEDEFLQVLQLPYVGDNIAMLVLLPREKNGLESLEASLTPSFIGDMRSKLWRKKVEVSLPRFRLEYTKSLVPCFQILGINQLFNRGAELGAASDSGDLAVSEILHKAVLEVNEEGSEAAAATMACVMMCALIFDPVFTADHPFAFVIFDTTSDLILFMGRVDEL